MRWIRSDRADVDCLPLADRHYNRQAIGSPQFVPPGRCLVLKTDGALWVSSWPFAEYVHHACGFIREACAATASEWPDLPDLGMVTFIDPLHVQTRKIRGRVAIAHSYFEAGFVHVGYTKAGLWAMQLAPVKFPAAEAPLDDLPLLQSMTS
jgi:hypothetical protein